MKIENPKKVGYELIELKNPGTHWEFLIREIATSRLAKWEDFPDANTVREYLKKHRFPEDKHYSKEQFLNDIENESGEIFFCVAKRRTANFILNLCHELMGKST